MYADRTGTIFSENWHRDVQEQPELGVSQYSSEVSCDTGMKVYHAEGGKLVKKPRETYEEWSRSLSQRSFVPFSTGASLTLNTALHSPRNKESYEEWLGKLNSPQSQASTMTSVSPFKWSTSIETRSASSMKAVSLSTVVTTVPNTEMRPDPNTMPRKTPVSSYASAPTISEMPTVTGTVQPERKVRSLCCPRFVHGFKVRDLFVDQVKDVIECRAVLDGVLPKKQEAVEKVAKKVKRRHA